MHLIAVYTTKLNRHQDSTDRIALITSLGMQKHKRTYLQLSSTPQFGLGNRTAQGNRTRAWLNSSDGQDERDSSILLSMLTTNEIC